MPDKNILIVDDAPANLDMLEILLTQHGGYRVMCAPTGEQAVHLMELEIPDIVLLDMMMPGISGFDVVEYMRSQDHLAHIPIIFLSANHNNKERQKAFDMGVIAFVDKPYDMRDVLRLVQKATADDDTHQPE